MKVEGGRTTEIGEMIPQRYCSGRDAGGNDADERKSISVTEFAAQSNRSLHREKRNAHKHKSLYLDEIIRTGTRMPRIKRIFTDPCVSASTVAPVDVAHTYGSRHTWRSVFYRTPPIIDHDKKPQMKKLMKVLSNEGYASHTPTLRKPKSRFMNADKRIFVAINHRKIREERKAEEQKSLRSLWLINLHGLPTAQGNKEKIIFQTGLTGSTGW